MKKTILLLALTGVLFSACKKEKNEEVKKLPSMLIESWDGGNADTIYYTYNSNHQIIKMNAPDNSYYHKELIYDSEGRLSRVESYDQSQFSLTFTYSGNSITMIDSTATGTDTRVYVSTLTTNDKEQYLRKESSTSILTYTYDANGSITQFVLEEGTNSYIMTFTPSTSVKGIFRHSNTPEWFLTYWYDGIYSKNGYMPVKREDDSWLSNAVYQTDGDGYVTILTDANNYDNVRTNIFTYQTIQ